MELWFLHFYQYLGIPLTTHGTTSMLILHQNTPKTEIWELAFLE